MLVHIHGREQMPSELVWIVDCKVRVARRVLTDCRQPPRAHGKCIAPITSHVAIRIVVLLVSGIPLMKSQSRRDASLWALYLR